jgi:hypothetical protein
MDTSAQIYELNGKTRAQCLAGAADILTRVLRNAPALRNSAEIG